MCVSICTLLVYVLVCAFDIACACMCMHGPLLAFIPPELHVYVLLHLPLRVAVRMCVRVCACDEMRLDFLRGCSSTEAT